MTSTVYASFCGNGVCVETYSLTFVRKINSKSTAVAASYLRNRCPCVEMRTGRCSGISVFLRSFTSQWKVSSYTDFIDWMHPTTTSSHINWTAEFYFPRTRSMELSVCHWTLSTNGKLNHILVSLGVVRCWCCIYILVFFYISLFSGRPTTTSRTGRSGIQKVIES